MKRIYETLKEKISGLTRKQESETKFEGLMGYLRKEYGKVDLRQMKEDMPKENWEIVLTLNTGEEKTIGQIKEYTKSNVMGTEFGYEAEITTKEKKVSLKYRLWESFVDPNNGILELEQSPRRYDTEEVPFP